MKIAVIGTVASSILGFRRDFIISLVAAGHQVYAFALDYTDEDRRNVIEMGAVPHDYTFDRAGVNPILDIVNTLKLAKLLKAAGVDMVFSYFGKPVIFATLAAKLAGVNRRIGMLEGLGFVFTDQPEGVSLKVRVLRQIQVLLYRLSFPLLEKIIFLNPDDPKDLVDKYQISAKRVEVLGGIGLNLSKYPYVRPSSGDLSFLFVGRLLKEKGIHDFLAAAKIVKQQYPLATFIVLGGFDEDNPGGIKAEELAELVDSGVIEYPGQVTNVAEHIALSSVFVLPSYYREGVPRSTQEAMAIGRPVITTDVPGCRETVIDGVNGFLVKPWEPQALAEKMIYFIKYPENVERMGLESYRIAQEKFDAVKVNRRLIELLEL